MLEINPYLHFMGNTGEAMNYYKSVFGGEFTISQRYKDVPGGEKMRPEEQEKFIHISLKMKNGPTIMATDALESMGQKLTSGDNFHICIHMESEADAEKAFEALSVRGKVHMPMNRTFWGAYFGMCRDQFGIQWMINHTYVK